ncbi:hypothetical protein YC2023_033156 [Brassica napus]
MPASQISLSKLKAVPEEDLYLRSERRKNLHQWREVKPKNVVIQNRKALGDIGNLVNIPTGKDIARKAEFVVITSLEEDEKSCKPHITKSWKSSKARY